MDVEQKRKEIQKKALAISMIFHSFDQEEVELTGEEEIFWEQLTVFIESQK